MTMQKAPVAERALAARIHRHLTKDGKALRKNKPSSAAFATLGPYYVTSPAGVVATHVDLENFGRELGLLAEWEMLES